MAIEEFWIDFSKSEIHECGATLVVLLAYPGDDNEDIARANLHASLCALALRARFEGSPDELAPQLMKPIHAFRTDEKTSRDLKTLMRRLRDRMIAARMAIGFLQLAAGKQPKLPAGIQRLSINQLSELVLEEAEQAEPENVEARIWRPSLPVIHLAAATAVMIDVAERNGFGRFGVGELLTSRPLIEAIVREAQIYETLMSQSSHFSKNPKNFIRLRIAAD